MKLRQIELNEVARLVSFGAENIKVSIRKWS